MSEKLKATLEPIQKNGIVTPETSQEISVIEPEEEEGLIPLRLVKLSDIDSLVNAKVAPIDLMSSYWSPENAGESIRCIFDRFSVTQVLSLDVARPGEIDDLECAFFFIKDEKTNTVKRISNGSKRLVGSLKAAKVTSMMSLEITYIGQKKNIRNSQFSGANWSIKPLI